MLEIIVSIPVILFSVVVETTVLSRVHILYGNANLIMLILIAWGIHADTRYSWFWFLFGAVMITYVSALPLYGYFVIFAVLWGFITFLKRRLWQMPLILMLFLTIFGTLLENVFSVGALYLQGLAFQPQEVITLITIPSLILNLLLAIPVFGIINDIADTVCSRSNA